MSERNKDETIFTNEFVSIFCLLEGNPKSNKTHKADRQCNRSVANVASESSSIFLYLSLSLCACKINRFDMETNVSFEFNANVSVFHFIPHCAPHHWTFSLFAFVDCQLLGTWKLLLYAHFLLSGRLHSLKLGELFFKRS